MFVINRTINKSHSETNYSEVCLKNKQNYRLMFILKNKHNHILQISNSKYKIKSKILILVYKTKNCRK